MKGSGFPLNMMFDFGVKLGIRSSAIDDRNKKAIDRAVCKAISLITAE